MTSGTATGAHPRSRSHHRADTQREPIQLPDDGGASIVQRGERFPESQSADPSSVCASRVVLSRSRLTSHAPIQSAGVTPRRPDSRRLNAAAPFLPVETTLKRGQFAQAVLDVIAVFVTILFLMSVALSIPLAVFLMIFAA